MKGPLHGKNFVSRNFGPDPIKNTLLEGLIVRRTSLWSVSGLQEKAIKGVKLTKHFYDNYFKE
jgi:hypothetical protein